MHTPNRRDFLKAGLFAGTWPAMAAAIAPAADVIPPIQLGFSLYGMKNLPLADAVKSCGEIGYDGVELCLLPGYPTDPTKFGKEDRKRLRDLLQAAQLAVPCFMENLVVITSPAEHLKNLDRIARAAELWNDLYPESLAPSSRILETVLGGKPADWPGVRESMAAFLRDWAETARKHALTIAIKPHVSGAVHLPESAVQLLNDVDSPHLQAVYDFSHYQVQGLKMRETFQTLVDRTVFVHVKDGRRVDGKVQFLLPGDGDVNYQEFFNLPLEPGTSITVEVSGQISGKPDYDPRTAAKRSFDHLAAAIEARTAAPVKKP